MKASLLTTLSLICFLGVFFTSCGSNAPADKSDKAYTAAYVCPMHCAGSGSDEPGTCPVCKMDYEKNTDHKADEHKHESDGEGKGEGDGHNHEHDGDHDGHDHGTDGDSHDHDHSGDHDGHNH